MRAFAAFPPAPAGVLLGIVFATIALADQVTEHRAVQVTVEADAPEGKISSYLTGMHFVYAFERDSLYEDERIADWMRRARVGIIRWPGGTAVQHYHWDDLNGIAFEADSWDPRDDETPAPPSAYMDLDEYIAYCRRVGAEPMVGINIRSGKVYKREAEGLDEARRLIQYCKVKGYAVKHWYIGNECFIGWGPKSYAETLDRYAAELKSVDPEIVIVGDWKFGPETKKRFDQVVAICKASKHIDVMEIHEKWGNRWGLASESGHKTFADWQGEAGIYGGRLGDFINRFFEEMQAAGKDVKLAFNEWGASVEDGDPFQVALVKADYLIEMFRRPIYSACDWNLNMGPGKSRILITRDNGHTLVGLNPAAQVFEICGHAMGGQRLPMRSSDERVYGFAARHPDGSGHVYLLNKHPETIRVELNLRGTAFAGTRHTIDSFVAPGRIEQRPVPPAAGASTVSVVLAPLSFNRILSSAE